MVQSTLLGKASVLLHLGSTTPCGGGGSCPSTTNLVLTVAELQCTRLYGAGYHQGCCMWGVGSSYTTRADIREQRRTEKRKNEARKELEEGGKTTPEVEHKTGKEKRGWTEEEWKRQWCMSRTVQFPLLLPCIHVLCVLLVFLSFAYSFITASLPGWLRG